MKRQNVILRKTLYLSASLCILCLCLITISLHLPERGVPKALLIALCAAVAVTSLWMANAKSFLRVRASDDGLRVFLFGKTIQCFEWNEIAEVGVFESKHDKVIYLSKMKLTETEVKHLWIKYMQTGYMVLYPYSAEAYAYFKSMTNSCEEADRHHVDIDLKSSIYWSLIILNGWLITMLLCVMITFCAIDRIETLVNICLILTAIYLIYWVPWMIWYCCHVRIDDNGVTYKLLFYKKYHSYADFKGVVIPKNAFREKEYIQFCLSKVVKTSPYRPWTKRAFRSGNQYMPIPRIRRDATVKPHFIIVPYISALEQYLMKCQAHLLKNDEVNT